MRVQILIFWMKLVNTSGKKAGILYQLHNVGLCNSKYFNEMKKKTKNKNKKHIFETFTKFIRKIVKKHGQCRYT